VEVEVADAPNVTVERAIGKVAYLKKRRAQLAETFSGGFLSWSPTAELAWRQLDRLAAGRIAQAEQELRTIPPATGARDIESLGPPFDFKDESAYFEASVQLWRRSSQQMQSLCAGAGMPYFHFLQPNQYVPGSKPMGSRESASALRRDSLGARLVANGYPLLAQAGERLRSDNVHFHDLRMVFAQIEEPLYIDHCCHVNRKGSEIMAERMANLISADLSNGDQPPAEAVSISGGPTGHMTGEGR